MFEGCTSLKTIDLPESLTYLGTYTFQNSGLTSVTIPASEGGMGILPDHEPVLTVIKQGTLTVVEPDGDRHMFEVTDGFISFDSNKLTVAVERGHDVQYSGTAE